MITRCVDSKNTSALSVLFPYINSDIDSRSYPHGL